jgi:hypothetical protein
VLNDSRSLSFSQIYWIQRPTDINTSSSRNLYRPSRFSMVPLQMTLCQPFRACFHKVTSTIVSPLNSSKPLSFLILILVVNFGILRNPACTPCDFHNNLWLFDHSNFVHSLQNKFFSHSLRLETYKTLLSMHAPCTDLYYTCTCVGISSMVSLLSFLR